MLKSYITPADISTGHVDLGRWPLLFRPRPEAVLISVFVALQNYEYGLSTYGIASVLHSQTYTVDKIVIGITWIRLKLHLSCRSLLRRSRCESLHKYRQNSHFLLGDHAISNAWSYINHIISAKVEEEFMAPLRWYAWKGRPFKIIFKVLPENIMCPTSWPARNHIACGNHLKLLNIL